MPSTYKTPGVYIEEISKFPPSVAQVETAIPAFIGYTQKAKVRGVDFHAEPNSPPIPVRITSMLEYEQFFGSGESEAGIKVTVTAADVNAAIENPSPHVMYYSLQAYFANGGGPCYIVSVGGLTGSIEQDKLLSGLDAIKKEDEVTLIVFPESLSLSSISDFASLYSAALTQCNDLQDRFVVMDAKLDDPTKSLEILTGDFRSAIGINYLKYGAAYGPRVKTIFDYIYNEADVDVTVPISNANPPSTETVKMNAINPGTEAGKSSPYGQYYPLVKSAIGNIPVVLPAAPLVVGVYAAVDSTRGVFKAPANVSLNSVIGPTIKISSEEQENLNLDTTGKAINAIRSFTGKGTLIWGARTLAGNDNEWRYIPVRRFFNMAEESIKKATEQFVFEPNDANTWTKVQAMIENFLTLQWRAGALAGAKPEQAFYVKIGLNQTMTSLDILEGRMIVEIGMAVVRPAEFIILKFSHKMQES
ncbi:MAG: phage tail sheath family protein [Synechococcales bacterium]|nr:phage tail sheath family protein [Synechococcales bacterium]